MREGMPRFCSATRNDTGSVALLEEVLKAVTIASRDCLKNSHGDRFAKNLKASG